MKFNKIDKVILFGGAPLLMATVKHLNDAKIEVLVYTSPRHAVEVLDSSGRTLRDILDASATKYIETEDINTCASLRKEITKFTLGIGMGEAWSFDEDLINLFQGRLLDFMGIPLPRYRGGAHYTWMILRGDKQGACNLQIINKDMIQGEVDTGEIIKQKYYEYPADTRIPEDYFQASVEKEIEFIREFLQEVNEGKDFPLEKIDESKSMFFPRLNTLCHGWINWNWKGEEIERMICAFDEPYAGASTILNGIRVHLKKAYMDYTEKPFHPFQSGLITRILPDGRVFIATVSGFLVVHRIIKNKEEAGELKLKPGDRFFTPMEKLESSLVDKVVYGTK